MTTDTAIALNISQNPNRHHLDRRAAELAEQGDGSLDDLLSTSAVSEWLGVSVQFSRNRTP